MNSRRTYLDHNASAPLRRQARAAMLAVLDEHANPSSVHAEGRRARAILETAREQVAELVGARPAEVVFTSGATEANAWAMAGGWSTIAVTDLEHASVLAGAEGSGAHLERGGVDIDGRACLNALSDALANIGDPARTLLSLQLANPETGVIQPIAEAAALGRARGVFVHTDAVQAVGRTPVDFSTIGCDFLSISGHKIGGPKGIGALVIREGAHLAPLIRGGGQERRRRGGTQSVILAAGFGAAAAAAQRELPDWQRIGELRDELERAIVRLTPDAVILGAAAPRLANTICVARPGEQAATLVIRLDLAGIAVSAGSACSSGSIGRSPVLAAMGVAPDLAQAAIRISLGWSTTKADIAAFLDAWARIATSPSAQARLTVGAARPIAAGDA